MPQRVGLYKTCGEENKRLYAQLRGMDLARQRASLSELLDFTRLGRSPHAWPASSRGMKQKLGSPAR